MWLIRRALGNFGGRNLIGAAHLGPEREQRGAGGSRGRVEGKGSTDTRCGPLQPQQDVLGCDRRGRTADRRGHEGVAVTVTTHPGSETHEGRNHGGAATRRDSLQSVINAAVHVRDGRVEAPAEHRHDGANLVGGLRLFSTKRSGAPQDVDFFEDASARTSLIGAAAERRIQLVKQPRDSADGSRDRTPASLGRVGREDRVEAEPLEALEGSIVADFGGEADERGGHRVGRVFTFGAAVALTQYPHTLVLFGEIHEVEVRGERAGNLIRSGHGEGVRNRRCPAECLVGRVGVGSDRREAQPLDVVIEPCAPAFAQHLTEQRSQQADVGAHLGRQFVAGIHTADQINCISGGRFMHALHANGLVFRGCHTVSLCVRQGKIEAWMSARTVSERRW